MMEGGKPTGCVLTYVRMYVRTYVRYVLTHVQTYVRQSPSHISKTVTNLRACARAYFLGPRRPNSSQTRSRKPRHDTKSSNAVEDGAKTPPGTPLRAPGRSVIPPGTLPRRLHRCLGNLRTYVHVKNRPRPPSRRPPGRPRSPKSLLIGPDEIKTVHASPQHAPKAGLGTMSGRF